ncbi:MAG: ABC transporter substrate-binding protein [Meiothermus sp.]
MHRVLTLFMLLLGLSAMAQRPTEIVFWHTSGPPAQDLLEGFIKEFNAQQKDYKITYRFVGDYREGGIKLLAALRSGGAPHLFHGEISFLGRVVQEGLGVPLDGYLAGIPNDFFPGFLETGKVKGQTYGLPIGLSVPVFFYNADQFAAKGLKAPSSWEDVANAAQKLTSRAAKGYIVSSDIYSFNVLVMSRGGSLVGKDGKPNFTDARVVESLEYLQEMVKKGSAQSRNIAEAQFSVADFLRTKAFMGVAPITAWPLIEDRAPIPFKLGVTAIPRTSGGKVPLAGGALIPLKGVSPEQVKGIVAFWKYLMEPANIAKWVKTTYYLPMRRAAQPLLEDWYKADPRRRVAFAQVEEADVWLQDPEFVLWYGFLEEALERALKGGTSAKAALEEAQRKALQVERK